MSYGRDRERERDWSEWELERERRMASYPYGYERSPSRGRADLVSGDSASFPPPMDYREAYRLYERGPAVDAPGVHLDDSLDRGRKRPRSPSPARYGADYRYRARSPPVYAGYGAADPWGQDREYFERERSPYSSRAGYEPYRERDVYERERAREWERYHREREAEYRERYSLAEEYRYGARTRIDESRPKDRDDRVLDRERATQPPFGDPDYDPYERRTELPSQPKEKEAKAPPVDPLQSETLVPFRVYAQISKASHPSSRDRLVAPPTTQELYEGYQAYRSAFSKKAMWNFFTQKREEAWFKEKYGIEPENVEERKARKKLGRTGKKESWLQELRSGKLDKVDYDLKTPASESELADKPGALGSETKPNADEDAVRNSAIANSMSFALISRYGEQEIYETEQVGIPSSPNHIMIKSFPPDISREKLEQHLKSRPGFRYLALGEPHSGKKWHRVGWAVYEEGTDMEATLQALDGKDIDNFTLHLALSSRPASGKLRTVPEYANSFARLTQDLKHIKALTSNLEREDRESLFLGERAAAAEEGKPLEWLETNASEAIEARCDALGLHVEASDLDYVFDPKEDDDTREQRRRSLKKHLDLHLDLLRHVYNCDYYLALMCDFPEELVRRSPRHARKQPPKGTLVESPREGANDESWSKSIDQKISLLLSNEASNLEEYGGRSLDAELLDAALAYVKEEEKEKHRCIVEVGGNQCGKLFKAAIFVQKHVMNKHRAFLESVASARIKEAKFFNNFVRDPSRAQAPAATPSNGLTNSSTPISQRLGGVDSTPSSSLPIFSTSRMGLIRLGGSSLASDGSSAPHALPYRGMGDRRSSSPGRKLSDRMGATAAIGGFAPMSMVTSANGASSTPLGMRIGGLANNSGSGTHTPSTRRDRASMDGGVSGLSPRIKPAAEPLPEAPKPLDPRAAKATPKSYQDLDGPVAEGDLDDLAY
ncbi:hypothetical protein IE53DRAFT_163723 [Violaceomyces palustris]|uniref:Uncharacterized protein n=1 Tax=Violaceomyces palustris TaxID=1673888 RepID=A0ACD0NTD1_9BASI|nr:hypothetical protein IE53DRAFT_163723 [Violaceomyces palustris]